MALVEPTFDVVVGMDHERIPTSNSWPEGLRSGIKQRTMGRPGPSLASSCQTRNPDGDFVHLRETWWGRRKRKDGLTPESKNVAFHFGNDEGAWGKFVLCLLSPCKTIGALTSKLYINGPKCQVGLRKTGALTKTKPGYIWYTYNKERMIRADRP